MPRTNPMMVQTMPTIPCTTACQGESISQAWLKQFTAHKATLMYRLYWGKIHSNPTIHYDTFPSLQQFPPQATLYLQQRSLTFCACKKTYPHCRDAKRNICVLRRTQNWLFVCMCVRLGERDGGGELTDNSLCDCLVRKCSFIPFLLSLIYVLIWTRKSKSWRSYQLLLQAQWKGLSFSHISSFSLDFFFFFRNISFFFSRKDFFRY